MHFSPALIAPLCALAICFSACKTPRPAVPGHTPYSVTDVVFEGSTIGLGELPVKLGMRAGNLLIPSQNYNVFRAEEDKRRVRAYWMTRGFLDAVIEGPLLEKDEPAQEVVITWKVNEGPRYKIGSVKVEGVPSELRAAVEALVPFSAGDLVDDIQAWRLQRVTMSELMRAHGYAHAETFSRLFIHKKKRTIHWIYYVDSGPRTRVGSITIHGAKKIPKDVILRRMGLGPGDPYDHGIRAKAEMALLDLGSFNVVRIQDDVDNEFLIGALPPDLGGTLRPGHVDADGKMLKRQLPAEVKLNVHVQEAPAHKGRVGLGVSADTGRLDGHLSLATEFRDLFGPTHHLLMDGRVAYGWVFDGETDDPIGLYGDGTIRYDSPGFLHRSLDLRVYATWSEELLAGYHNRGLRSGLGFRTAVSRGAFLDVDLAYRLAWPVGFPELSEGDEQAMHLDASELSVPELKISFVWDRRDNPVEALDGYLLGLDASLSPGGGTHAYLSISGQARTFFSLGNSMAIGLRTQGSWLFDLDGKGLPPVLRLFGGGAFGMRGFGHQRFTSAVEHCQSGECRSWGVGSLSLLEAGFDFRWLPFRKQFGANLFVDIGGASVTTNPFENGLALAVGLGSRVRLWYIPLSLDVSYRALGPDDLSHLSPWLFFARIGESF